MSIRYGCERTPSYYERPPPRYSLIVDEKVPLIEKQSNERIKQVLGMRRSSFLLSLYLVFYMVYLITGGLVFAVLEGPQEEELRQAVSRARIEFLKENPCVQDQALEDLIELIISANERGVSAVRNATGEPNWSFGQSLFFSSTVVTTIGYGHVTPLSQAGKSFCIIYAILGIPLTLMLLTALVERLMLPSTILLRFLNARLGHLYQPFNIRLLHLCVIGSILLTFFWFIPAAIFAYLEPEWDYLDSMYYCFISLTTIGLGDYIPGDSPNQPNRPLYKVFTTGYLLIGLTFLIFTLTVFYEIPQLNFGMFFLMQSDEADISTDADPEKVCLHSSEKTGLKYTQQIEEQNKSQNAVKVKARNEDSLGSETKNSTQSPS